MGDWTNKLDVKKLENEFHRLGTINRAIGLGSDEYFHTLRNEADYRLAYNSCPPLKFIVGKRASAFNAGVMEVLNRSNGNYARGAEARELKTRLERPNALQTAKQFRSQQNIYIDVYGYCPVLKVAPVGFEDGIPSAMWNIPPWLFDVKYGKDFLYKTDLTEIYKSFWMEWDGRRVELSKENLFFIFDDGIGTDTDVALTIPDSRLVSLEYPVSNIVAAYKARNTLITKKGAIGILSNDGRDQAGTVPLPDGEKDQVQKAFSRYGITGQPYQVIITEAALKWQQMGTPTKDLMLFEEIEDDVNQITDAYGYPVELVSRKAGVTYANKREAKRDLYEDTIIPQAESRVEQLNRGLLGEDSSLVISVDYSHVEVLQDGNEAKARARKALNETLKMEYDNGLITKNDWLEALGRDRVNDPEFDKYKTETTNSLNNESDPPENTGA